MKQSTLKSFEKFLSLIKDPKKAFNQDSEEIDETIKPFLFNSEKHFEHVKLITEARWGIHFSKLLIKRFPKPLRWLLIPSNKKWSDEYLSKLDSLKKELLAATEPVDLNFDVLPSKLLETPLEWKSLNKQIHLIEIKTGITPLENLYPKSLDLKIEFENDKNLQLISSFPSTDFSEAGKYKVGMNEEGKFISSSKVGGELKLGAEYQGQSAKIELGKRNEKENTSSKFISYEFEYANRVLKVLSSSVKSKANWKLLQTADHMPIGGQDFYVTILIPDDLVNLKYKAKLSVDIESWGIAEIKINGNILLGKNNNYA